MNKDAESELLRILRDEFDKEIIRELKRMATPQYIEEQIRFYDDNYKSSKEGGHYNLSVDSLVNSILLRQKKIIRDHCS